MIHVLPINDSDDHYSGSQCPCNPSVKIEDDIVVIHNAFDNRELIEELIEEKGIDFLDENRWVVVSVENE